MKRHILVAAGLVASVPGSALAWSSRYTQWGLQGTHHEMTKKALDYLRARGLWDDSIHPDAEALIQHGVHWADAPWFGRPEAPGSGGIFGVREYYALPYEPDICWTEREPGVPPITTCVPDNTRRIESASECHGLLESCTDWLDLCAGASREWIKSPNWTSSVRFHIAGVDTEPPPPVWWPHDGEIVYVPDACSSDSGRYEQFAVDNLFHYGLDPTLSAVTLELRPSDSALPESERQHLDGLQIYSDMSVGVAMYGAVLYQLARKYADMSWAEPSLSELVFVASSATSVPLGQPHSGRIAPNDSLYDNINLDLPATYLGGMPQICAGTDALDMCETGTPTWPVWIPETYATSGSSAAEREAFVGALMEEHPGRSNSAALVYLGWAAHMIQDASMPLHANGTTGPRHAAIDSRPDGLPWTGGNVDVCDAGDRYMPVEQGDGDLHWACWSQSSMTEYDPYAHSFDEYLARSLDPIFGTASAPRSRDEICEGLQIVDGQLVPGELGWDAVTHLFQDVVEDSRPCGPSISGSLLGGTSGGCGYLEPTRRGVRATAALLACFRPQHLSPGLTVALLSPLT